jgi:hypothetical protein
MCLQLKRYQQPIGEILFRHMLRQASPTGSRAQ